MGYTEILNEANSKALEQSDGLFERIKSLFDNAGDGNEYSAWIKKTAAHILLLKEYHDLCTGGAFASLSLKEMQSWNERLYSEVYEANYGTSLANPEYAVKCLGEKGVYLADIFASIIDDAGPAAKGFYFDLAADAALFEEAANLLLSKKEAGAEDLKALIRKNAFEKLETNGKLRAAFSVDPDYGIIGNVIKNADLSDLRYLYRMGLHITQNEIDTASFINSLPEKDVRAMAKTFTDGFLVGYAKLGVDIHKKKAIAVYHVAGFERMIKYAIENMEKEGLKAVVAYAATTDANRQFDYDWKNSMSVYLDEKYLEEYLKAFENGFEYEKENASGFAGPLALETYGEKEFQPVNKKEALNYDEKQQELLVTMQNENAMMRSRYIKPEERSFAIISYPVPAIGEKFREIFEATVKVNTLDYKTYETIQQKLIDALDMADTVHVKGLGKNRTDLTVNICKLTDPSRQSAFENCVADVNIPVGEVFTSPVLKETNGMLNVGKVYLNGMLVKDLEIILKDGMIEKCTCGNFEKEEDNRKYLDDIIMFHHKTLPIGEFAIGTNTTAYKMGIDFDIQDKLPILIAEKTGPHFAMGDTCYSRSEEIKVFNPDGKEIIARENEVSLKRHTNPAEAYFNCHTDITIPYNELDTIDVIKKNGETIRLIDKGRFVLPGTEELNKPLIELYGE